MTEIRKKKGTNEWWVDFECWSETGETANEVEKKVYERIKNGEYPSIVNIEPQEIETNK